LFSENIKKGHNYLEMAFIKKYKNKIKLE